MKKISRRGLMLAASGVVLAAPAGAQAYPSRPIRIIVPFAAGGSSDIMARVAAERLREAIGQAVVVENRTGAGGTLGAELVARAPADGYTLLLGTSATQSIAPSIYTQLSYDPAADFAPISQIARIPLALVVGRGVSATNLREFIEHARGNPGSIEFASSGNGSITHLSSELFAFMAGVRLLHVPYRGSAPAVTDLLGGQVQMMIDHVPTVISHIRSGSLRALGVADPARIPELPDVPTISEAGLDGYQVRSWVGLVAPRGTPQEIVTRLNASLVQGLNSNQVREQIAAQGARVATTSPAEFADIVRADIAQWRDVVTRANVRL